MSNISHYALYIINVQNVCSYEEVLITLVQSQKSLSLNQTLLRNGVALNDLFNLFVAPLPHCETLD